MFQLCINEQQVAPADVDAETTLLEYLRQHLRLMGTKEGCASGDCGACTVVIGRAPNGTIQADGAQADAAQGLVYGTANSCILPLASLHGAQVLTVDALATPSGLHPVQDAMVRHHGSQCGFCTPGFIMTLAGAGLPGATHPELRGSDAAGAPVLDEAHGEAPGHDAPLAAIAPLLAGNLCRCTGYRSILEAARELLASPPAPIAALADAPARLAAMHATAPPETPVPRYHAPTDEPTLLRMLGTPDASANTPSGPATRLVSGATDLWLEVTQQYRRFERVIDVSGIPELMAIEIDDDIVSIGSAVTHERLLALFGAGGALPCPAIADMLERFASPQIRRRATLGGNIANGSPIADWPPVLLALDAEAEIGHADGTRSVVALSEFWLGYRRTVLAPGQYLRAIRFRRLADWNTLRVHKVTKRHEDDISSVLVATRIEFEAGRVALARVACGGVAATPVRLASVEARLVTQPRAACLEPGLLADIDAELARTLAPISDVRASAAYRSAMVRALLLRSLEVAAGRNPEDLRLVAVS
jgi:xanthine dehydrogenase small subunit